jgi:hypothetical protein
MSKVEKSSVKLVEMCENLSDGKFYALVEFTSISGTIVRVRVPRCEVGRSSQLRETLLNAGARIESKKAWDETLSELRQSAASAPCMAHAARLGWTEDHLFVLPKRVIAPSEEIGRLRPPLPYDGDHLPKLRVRGELSEWKQGIAQPATFSSRIVFMLCAGFAAPLLKTSGLNSFGFLVEGPSKTGKSTALLALGSLLGYAQEDDLLNFFTSEAAEDEILFANNDLAVPINELGLKDGDARQRNKQVSALSYRLAENRSKAYSRFAPIDGRMNLHKRRNILVATGEESAEKLAALAGELRQHGAAVRFFDLPALHKEAKDIFDLSPSDVDPSQRKIWFAETCDSIRRCARVNHGKALRVFLEKIVREPDLLKSVPGLMSDFSREVIVESDEQIVAHLAKQCALICAAGLLAVRVGIVPWTEALVVKCVRRCFFAARISLRLDADLVKDGCRIILDAISRMQRMRKIKASACRRLDGYWRVHGGRKQAVFRGSFFPRLLSDSRLRQLVLVRLHSAGALVGIGSPPRSGKSFTWAECQPMWPDQTRPRSIVVDVRRVEKLI